MITSDTLGPLIPMVVSLGLFAMVFGIVYLHKREKMAMIERGMDPRRYKPQSAPFQNLKWGLLLMGSGMGLFLAYMFDSLEVFHKTNENPAIYFALIAMCGGSGLIVSYLIEKKDADKGKGNEKVD